MRNCQNKGILLLFVLLANLIFCVNISSAQNTRSANLFFGAGPAQIQEGERVTIDVKINSPFQSINAISGVLSYPPELVRVVSVSKERSIIDLWTQEPKLRFDSVSFEGIVLNPGFQSANGLVFSVTLEAKNKGIVLLKFREGAILANDGRGTNIIATLGSANFKIISSPTYFENKSIAGAPSPRPLILPVITDYSPLVGSTDNLYVKGKGEPNALTKIIFKDVSVKSVGEKLIALFQTKKKKLDEVFVKGDKSGAFEYVSAKNLMAGVYNATPFLVDVNTNTEKPGLGVQLLVNDSKTVKMLVLLINILGLLIPIVGLVVIIYFIPWYSFKRMRVLKKKLGFEEEKIEISSHQLERQEKILDQNINSETAKKEP